MKPRIRYRVAAPEPRTHAFAVELEVDSPDAQQALSLPVWIPGSYLVREFARHVSRVEAEQGGRGVAVRSRDKASWIVDCEAGSTLVVRYRVHAFDVSVRAAWLDETRGFWNGTSVCLRVEGRDDEPHALAIGPIPAGWAIATSLPPTSAATFVASGYADLVDHPVEIGRFDRHAFAVRGVAHSLVVTGAYADFDGERFAADVTRVCGAVMRFWHGDSGEPPFTNYLFLLNAVDEGRGGLEHGTSTALVAPRRELPRLGHAETADGHVDVLGLVCHEYFHAWNVKRLKPREFASLDWSRENYTGLLWFFEGFTSYYDDLLVARSGIVDGERYLKLLAKTMSTVAATPGRFVQSVAAASRDAWVKYYRPDENTPNSTVSYYAKGALVALAFDLTLRREGRATLDDVMRSLWRTSAGGPIDEADIASALETAGGRSFAPELADWVHGTAELPLAGLLAAFGVAVESQAATLAQRLGVKVSESALTGVKVTHVLAGGAGEAAGLVAGDELLAAGDWRLRRLDDALRAAPTTTSATLPLLVSRDQRVRTVDVDLAAATGVGNLQLRRRADATADQVRRFEAWLAG